MKKKQKKLRKKQQQKPSIQPLDLLFGLIIAAYIFVPTFTPNWMSLDTNTPKFFMTALLNLVVFVILLANGYFKEKTHFLSGFFTINTGLAYTGLMVITLLSFIQSANILESVLHFTKLFTVFASVFNLSVILMHNLRYVRLIILVIAGLLVFDSISVFVNINKFIIGEIGAIADIKTVYSNKNILASAIFVKLPFAIWLLVFERKYLKIIGWVALTFGITATFFMATRAFYLGLTVISLAFIGYQIVVYFRQKQKSALVLTGAYVGALLIALAVFSFTQNVAYPKSKKSRHTQGVVQQMATLQDPESASSLRLDAWRWSLELIREKPLLGVGVGNWKVDILKHENQKNSGFIYLYKAHNDFLETTAETGIIGGLLFLSLFVFTVWNFLNYYKRKKNTSDDLYRYLFIAAAGVIFYSVDAVFNFPHDRPEITALFAIFLSIGIAAAFVSKLREADDETIPAGSNFLSKPAIGISVTAVAIILLAGSTWVLWLNFQSSKTQRIVYQEIMAGNLNEPSGKIIAGFPFIPNVSVWGEPIETLKARYLIQEEKYDDAIEILRADHTSPWDARREFFMAMAYNNLKEYDSALHYSQMAVELKPNYFRNLHLAATLLERKGEKEQVAAYYDSYLDNNKKDSQAWLVASNFHIQNKDYQRASELIEEASGYFRRDSLIEKQQRFLHHKLVVEPNLDLFNEANAHYQSKRYQQAIEKLDAFIELVPDYVAAFQIRSFAHYYLDNHEKCIENTNQALKLDPKNSSLINLRGVCYRALDDLEKACNDFKRSMQMGNDSGKTNYERFCRNDQ
jgi:putative inorganic carbon (hco3(-)) transporter